MHDAADIAFAFGDDVEESLAVQAERHRAPQFGVIERRLVAIDDQVTADIGRVKLADRLRRLARQVLGQRHRQAAEGDVELPADERQYRRRDVLDYRVFDAVEVRALRLPVIAIARDRDPFVWLELDEFERAGADRMLAHLPWRHMAGVDRRKPGGEQREQRRLRPLQAKRDLMIAICGDLPEIATSLNAD